MNKNQIKKFAILFATFVVPLLFFLFLASGKVNFTKLPVLTTNVKNMSAASKVSFRNKVSVVSFLGEEESLMSLQGMLNLYQVVYKSTEKYAKFQVVVLVPNTRENGLEKLKSELAFVGGVDLKKWHFVMAPEATLSTLFSSLESPYSFDVKNGVNEVFIVDEDLSLRGRTDDEDAKNGVLFGYDTQSVAVLKNKLREDLKVIFYESKFAVKEPKLK
ncbi:hypothetical protein ACFLRU_06445 [Bacteroidota bacterium]